MNDVNYTLFKTLTNNQPNDYQLQITTDFGTSTMDCNNQEVTQLPSQNGDFLKVKLKFKTGTNSHVVHDFSIGNFPINIENWKLEVEYVDENGTKVKEKGQTAQAEIEARPRPGFAATFNS